jgi:hypothetical protein
MAVSTRKSTRRCCPIRCRGTPSAPWPGGGCRARAPIPCSSRVPGIRWPGCCRLCRRWRTPARGHACAHEVYGQLKNGFYGLAATLLTQVVLALAGEPRAEGATWVPPGALGRVLGLDRAPEVKTIRRKLGQLASAGKAHELIMVLARRHAAAGLTPWASSTSMDMPARTTGPGTCRRPTSRG